VGSQCSNSELLTVSWVGDSGFTVLKLRATHCILGGG
jgi:hypothetical protein